jgi:hypothetical protein
MTTQQTISVQPEDLRTADAEQRTANARKADLDLLLSDPTPVSTLEDKLYDIDTIRPYLTDAEVARVNAFIRKHTK